jgi:decaprenylphospho-beta-D-erythro-pentofuranosid-2-ulose 2-reductase
MKTPVLILGAASGMARAIARSFAAEGHPIQLAARNVERLETDRDDLVTRYGVEVTLLEFDALDLDGHADFVAALPALPQVAVCAVGAMGTQEENAARPRDRGRRHARQFRRPRLDPRASGQRDGGAGSGTLVGISSVAGERGRASNYVYGSAKAGFTAFLSGLRNRLAKKGVHVVTVLPGFVATAMTEGMDLPARLTAEPEEVGAAVVKAVQKGRNVIYARPIWRIVMAVIRNIPEPIFKKTSL